MGNHRAERGSRRSTSAAGPVAGKRRAATPQRTLIPRALPSAPLIAGVAVLAVSAGGAVSAADAGSQRTSDGVLRAAGAISSAAGTEALSRREAVVSRDSHREAADEAADAELVALAEKQAAAHQARLDAIRQAAEKQAAKIKENKWVLPMSSYSLTATFGEYGLWASYHTGLDFNGDSGDPIMAVANGTITSTGYDGSYGNKTVLTLDDGTEIWFCHQTSIHVSVGERVNGGDVIGTVGTTGNVTGSHLHLEVRPGGGGPVNPFDAFVEHGIVP
ncbi:M23 family metallopeptidase [Nocardioides seonyuensis]|uniref:M23 family metallopeptidase n=1 Tax=Nocardioides seonyuensis TaxID=2518371 RepID=A0A4P7IFZ2_9ACTN|nr:M23 family metallopeptidase [Nocardioides seonyuensis]QBX56209.1 M23 family metallopeptidase [Nocardioides seonyuensis]